MIPNKGKVLVDFYAEWCGPCKAMKPTLEKFEESSDIPLVKVNVDEEPNIAQEYGIRNIPCLVCVEDGNEVKRRIGVAGLDQLLELVK